MNDIADAVGVTKPVLYQHFDSKRDLYQALIDEVGARLLGNIAEAAAEATDGKSQTELGFRAYFGSVRRRPRLVPLPVRAGGGATRSSTTPSARSPPRRRLPWHR